ncbi:hypothetical protein ACVME5_006175 [Bradyrhizobium liaoningense]
MQILKQNHRLLPTGQAFDDRTARIGDRSSPCMRLQLVPVWIRYWQIEHRVERGLLNRRQILPRIPRAAGVLSCCIHCRQEDPLECAEGRTLKIRAGLGVDQPPAIGLQFLGKLMRESRLADARIAEQQNRLPACPGVSGCTLQQSPLGSAIDEARDTARPPHPPTRQVARAYDPIDRHGLAKAAQRLAAQRFEPDMSLSKLLAGFRGVDLVRLGRRFQPRGQVLRGTTDLVDLGELAGDHVGNDMAGVQADPHLKTGVTQACDSPHELDRRVTGHRRMIVVRNGSAEHRRKPIAQLLADDAAELPDRPSHRRQRRLQA